MFNFLHFFFAFSAVFCPSPLLVLSSVLDLQMLHNVRHVSAGVLNDLATHITLRRCVVDYCEILPYEAAKFHRASEQVQFFFSTNTRIGAR